MFYLRARISRSRRFIAAIALFLVGSAGIFGGLALGKSPLLQNPAVAYAWVGVFSALLVLASALFVPAMFEELRERRSRRGRRERWPYR